jgi:hypothetical protein
MARGVLVLWYKDCKREAALLSSPCSFLIITTSLGLCSSPPQGSPSKRVNQKASAKGNRNAHVPGREDRHSLRVIYPYSFPTDEEPGE